MIYNYQTERAAIFTEDGQRMFLSIRDRVSRLLKMAGAFSLSSAITGETGSSWQMMACVDRLVELGEIREVTVPGEVWGQHRVFVDARRAGWG